MGGWAAMVTMGGERVLQPKHTQTDTSARTHVFASTRYPPSGSSIPLNTVTFEIIHVPTAKWHTRATGIRLDMTR